jgi:hypothetical protein
MQAQKLYDELNEEELHEEQHIIQTQKKSEDFRSKHIIQTQKKSDGVCTMSYFLNPTFFPSEAARGEAAQDAGSEIV